MLSEASDVNLNGSIEPPSDSSDPNHQLMVLSNPRIGDGPGEYLCNVCNAKFVYKNNLKSHLKRHLGIYPYVCFCGKRYQFKCKLNKHIEQVRKVCDRAKATRAYIVFYLGSCKNKKLQVSRSHMSEEILHEK